MVISRYANQLKKIFGENDVLLAYLFGSSARGVEGPMSDIDIGILLKEPLSRAEAFDKRIFFTYKLASLFHTNKIDIIILNVATPEIKFNVIKDGKVIYNRDEKSRINFEMRTMSEYFDTAPLRKEYAESLFKNIEEGKFYDR